jgi:hypothetical protein
MTWGRLDTAQAEALAAVVRGRTIHDLGCGDQVLSDALVQLGAAAVIAVDEHPVGCPGSWVNTVRTTFAEYETRQPIIDVAFVSWPVNHNEPPLLDLLYRAKTIAYLGKCTDGTLCGWPGLFRYFLGLELVAHVPHPANTLLIYGTPVAAPRVGEWEERAGLDHRFSYPYFGSVPFKVTL